MSLLVKKIYTIWSSWNTKHRGHNKEETNQPDHSLSNSIMDAFSWNLREITKVVIYKMDDVHVFSFYKWKGNISCLPVTKITRKTAKKMLPPSYHPVERPCKDQKYNTLKDPKKGKRNLIERYSNRKQYYKKYQTTCRSIKTKSAYLAETPFSVQCLQFFEKHK